MPKLLAASLLALASISASASPDTTFREWVESGVDRYANPDLPPSGVTEGFQGGNFYIVDPSAPVEFTFITSHAGHTLELWVASANNTGALSPWEQIFIKTGESVGTTDYDLVTATGSYTAAGTEIVFWLHDVTSGFDYFSGPAGNNPDNYAHVVSFYDYYNGQTLVGFEDLYEGGDKDFDDIVFLVSNVGQTPAVPEPETCAMLLAGLGIVSALARRRGKMR